MTARIPRLVLIRIQCSFNAPTLSYSTAIALYVFKIMGCFGVFGNIEYIILVCFVVLLCRTAVLCFIVTAPRCTVDGSLWQRLILPE